jgi:hypothetical protein
VTHQTGSGQLCYVWQDRQIQCTLAVGLWVLVIDGRWISTHHDNSTAERTPWLLWWESWEGSVQIQNSHIIVVEISWWFDRKENTQTLSSTPVSLICIGLDVKAPTKLMAHQRNSYTLVALLFWSKNYTQRTHRYKCNLFRFCYEYLKIQNRISLVTCKL